MAAAHRCHCHPFFDGQAMLLSIVLEVGDRFVARNKAPWAVPLVGVTGKVVDLVRGVEMEGVPTLRAPGIRASQLPRVVI